MFIHGELGDERRLHANNTILEFAQGVISPFNEVPGCTHDLDSWSNIPRTINCKAYKILVAVEDNISDSLYDPPVTPGFHNSCIAILIG